VSATGFSDLKADDTKCGIWVPTMGFWIERYTGFQLLANVIAYEVVRGSDGDTMRSVPGYTVQHT
jgi:hypothetical protein